MVDVSAVTVPRDQHPIELIPASGGLMTHAAASIDVAAGAAFARPTTLAQG